MNFCFTCVRLAIFISSHRSRINCANIVQCSMLNVRINYHNVSADLPVLDNTDIDRYGQIWIDINNSALFVGNGVNPSNNNELHKTLNDAH